jgi:phosphoglycolate phosphatase-like HAD superfamily hydrolase
VEASLPKTEHLFIDNGGVITDNSKLARRYLRLVGEFLVPRLGGTAAGWAEANRATFPGVRERSLKRLKENIEVCEEYKIWNIDWLRSMCPLVGVDAPSDDEQCAKLASEANLWILARGAEPFPGAPDALRELARDYTLFTASEGLSFQLEVAMKAHGVSDLFTRLYGPDFVSTPKQSPRYHERIFAHAGVDPAGAVVVDDDPEQLVNAQRAGARTVLENTEPTAGDGFDGVIAGLYQLPDFLRRL